MDVEHAVECRVYAEDPANGFLPQAGTLRLYREPAGPGIRIDSGVEEGTDVPVQYDPMLAKLIASGDTRTAAIARASAALRRFPILGVRTNVAWLIRTLNHPEFLAGRLHTAFVDEHDPVRRRLRPLDKTNFFVWSSVRSAVSVACVSGFGDSRCKISGRESPESICNSCWRRPRPWHQ